MPRAFAVFRRFLVNIQVLGLIQGHRQGLKGGCLTIQTIAPLGDNHYLAPLERLLPGEHPGCLPARSPASGHVQASSKPLKVAGSQYSQFAAFDSQPLRREKEPF